MDTPQTWLVCNCLCALLHALVNNFVTTKTRHCMVGRTQPWRRHSITAGDSPGYGNFLHDRPWISPWIKSISNELDITIHVIAPQSSGHCDVIRNWLWHHQQNENWASETRGRCGKIVAFIVIMDYLCRVRNEIMYVLSWRTVSALTRVLFWYLFPSLLRNSGNKHQNNPLVSAETVRHSSTYIILYILRCSGASRLMNFEVCIEINNTLLSLIPVTGIRDKSVLLISTIFGGLYLHLWK